MIQTYINAALVFILSAMAVQDFRYRAISWTHFVMLGLFLCLSKGHLKWNDILSNLGFILAIISMLTAWFSAKSGKLVYIFSSYIGWGDFLFLISIALYFPFMVFFVFYLVSMILILVGSLIYLSIIRPKIFTVPLAGLQSLVLLVLLVWSWHTGFAFSDVGFINFSW